MSKVSAIITAYNRADLLPQALDSLLCQTCDDFEILVVDDGSTDATRAVLEAYLNAHPGRIRYVYQRNQGIGAARNRGMQEAGGDYIAFLDADDIAYGESIALRKKFLDERPQVAAVFSDYDVKFNAMITQAYLEYKGFSRHFQETVSDAGRGHFVFNMKFYQKYLTFSPRPIWTGSVMFRKRIVDDIGMFRTDFPVGEDNDYWARMVARYMIGYIRKPLALYRHCGSALTSYSEQYYLNLIQADRAYYREHFSRDRAQRSISRKKIAATYQELAYSCYKNKEGWKASNYALKSVLLSFAQGRAYRTLFAGALSGLIVKRKSGVRKKTGKNRRFLIASDLDMKRVDSWTEFTRDFIKECREKNIDVEFFIPTEPCGEVKSLLRQEGFEYKVYEHWWHRKEAGKRHNLRAALGILKEIMSKRPDLVAFHFCMESTAAAVSVFSRLLPHRPVLIWHQHDEIVMPPKGFSVTRRLSRLKMLSFLVDRICPVFKGQEGVLLERGISRSKIRTIYNGVDISRFASPVRKDELFKETGIPLSGQIVCTIGSLIPRKGLDYFLDAARAVVEEKPDTVFLIMGEGPLLEKLKSLAGSLGIGGKVFFLGRRNDVHRFLSVCDIFVLASLAEPFGLVNVEAMAAGKPVVATRVGGIPEIIEDGKSGLLVEPKNAEALKDAILALLNDRFLASAMGKRGRKIAEERFSLGVTVGNYLSVYEECLDTR